MRPRVLVVEDEPLIAEAVAFALERDAYEVVIAADARSALARASEVAWDVVILDLGLPDRSGLDVCRELRAAGPVPIIILTARDTEGDRVTGLESGADDYVAKPFSMPELVARVRAVLRRRRLDLAEAYRGIREAGDLTIDLERRECFVGTRGVHLTNAEFNLLALLIEKRNQVVGRREILSRLWSTEFVGNTRSCETYVARLRRKLEPEGRRPSRIVTVRGHGYKLAVPDETASELQAERNHQARLQRHDPGARGEGAAAFGREPAD